jgi:mono/diheme cytochrome c family protein
MRFSAAAVLALGFGTSVIACGALTRGASASGADAKAALVRGRYLVVYGNCNECHTPGWRESDGKLPQAQWLTGNRIGFRGDWGTSYPVNLRLEFQALAEDQWILAVRTRGGHPPMTCHDLRVLDATDRHAIYAFIKSLGPAGVPAPAAIPPWREPTTRYIETRSRAPATTLPISKEKP